MTVIMTIEQQQKLMHLLNHSVKNNNNSDCSLCNKSSLKNNTPINIKIDISNYQNKNIFKNILKKE